MSYKTWWDYYDENPYEKIGRYMPNAFGQPMIAELTRIAWEYVDWLRDVEKCDMDQFFIDNDRVRLPEDGCYHAWMEGALRTCFLRRERKALPRPDWLPSAQAWEFVDI